MCEGNAGNLSTQSSDGTCSVAYGNERMSAYLYLPKNARPPFETVIYFPGTYAVYERSSRDLDLFGCDFIVRSGRALVYPIYKGQYERGDALKTDDPDASALYSDHVMYWSKDLGRTIDYLEDPQGSCPAKADELRIKHR